MIRTQLKLAARSRLIGAVLFALLLFAPVLAPGDAAAHAQTIILKPDKIPEAAKNFRLEIRRADGRPFNAPAGTSTSIGIAHGVKLAMLSTTPDRAKYPRILNTRIDDLKRVWDIAPRAGDHLLVAVYAGGKPISPAGMLHVKGLPKKSSFQLAQKSPACGVRLCRLPCGKPPAFRELRSNL